MSILPATASNGNDTKKRSEPPQRVGPSTNMLDSTTVMDEHGKLYRVHYQRNALVIAHPILDGRAIVSADTTVRFWVAPDLPAASENDRLDALYIVDVPTPSSPPAPRRPKP